MPRFNVPSLFVVVGEDDACKLTGLSLTELVAARDVQELTRVLPDGRREPALRVPRALMLDAQPDE